jgi:hypothetical protein
MYGPGDPRSRPRPRGLPPPFSSSSGMAVVSRGTSEVRDVARHPTSDHRRPLATGSGGRSAYLESMRRANPRRQQIIRCAARFGPPRETP